MKQRIKNSFLARNNNKYERYPLHGQYSREINQPYIDKSESLAWMKNAKLKPETESTICAIQEQSVTTRYIEKHIHKSTDNDICRLCNTFPETIHHIIAGCPALSQNVYTYRHNNVAKYLYIRLSEFAGLSEEKEKWFAIEPPPVRENDNFKILWNFKVITDRRIDHNMPDIIFIDKREKSVKIIDIAIPMDKNVITKRFEKLRNYTNLSIELKESWELNCVSIVPIIIGSTGVIHREMKNDLGKLNFAINSNELVEMQTIALLGTAFIWRHFCELVK